MNTNSHESFSVSGREMMLARIREWILMVMRSLAVFCSCLVAPIGGSLAADEYADTIWPVLVDYCIDCHDAGSGKPKGDFDMVRFGTLEGALAEPEALKRIRNALHFQEMPPQSKKHQPSFDERRRVIDWINHTALRRITHHGRRDPGAPVLRRLTRLEYNNTLRDLLGLDGDVFAFPERLMARRDYFQPADGKMGDQLDIFIPEYGTKQPVLLRTENLPGDNRAAHGFFNQGDLLNLSPMLMERYLALATKIVSHPDFVARADGVAALFDRKVVARGSESASLNGNALVAGAAREFAPLKNIANDAPDVAVPAWLFTDHVTAAFLEGKGGVFQGAKGELRRGGAVHVRFGRKQEKTLRIETDNDLWFVDFATAHETSGPVNIANKVKGWKVIHLDFKVAGGHAEEGVTSLGVVVLSRSKGASGSVTLTAHFAGGGKAELKDEIATGAGNDNTFFSFGAPAGDAIVGLTFDGSQFSGDYALLDDLAFITGRSQLVAAQPSSPDEAVARVSAPQPALDVAAQPVDKRAAFAKFLGQAFRGEVAAAELNAYFGVYEREVSAGATPEAAMKEALRAVLSSPRLLFLVEEAPSAEPVRRLTGVEIANRLAYFLWASMPDEALFAAARAGELETESGIAGQVSRMLKDVRVKELSDSFAYQWLQLNRLIGAQPDRRRYPGFYDGPQGKATMAAPLLQESLLLFETVLVENRPVIELVDPGFTWLNPRLMEYYGLEDQFPRQIAASLTVDKRGNRRKDNDKWFRCELSDRRRGGVLSQGSVHTLTSLPLRTSPVYRGVWIAEVIFNRPPPPPPAVVAELGDDDRKIQEAGLTLRQKLELHREKSACQACHARIDPLGFAMENYDGIGRWRDSYGRFPVDAAGSVLNEHVFDGIVGFKEVLRKIEGEFARGFIRHLLTYALGRHLEAFDEQTVDEIGTGVAEGGYRLRDIVTAVATSYPFTHTRNEVAGEGDPAGRQTDGGVVGDVLSPTEQQSLARRIGAKAQRFEMWNDDAGNVTGLIFINHQALDKTVGPKPGVDDDDLLQFTKFPRLTAVNFEGQPLSDRGFAVLTNFPGLKQVGFHYLAKHPRAAASPDFIRVIEGMGDLEILEIKHNFRQDAINVDQLQGPFPKVWRLVLDVPLTPDQTMHLLRLCPNVTDLQLHRSGLTAEQLRDAAALAPNLEVLWWKPKGPLLAEHLAALKGFRKLRIFSPQHFKNELPYVNGWEHLAALPNLQRIEMSPKQLGDSATRLRAARPDLVIDATLTRSRNYGGF